eukprot:3658-Heterocapsa_arctica.AAC.1
MSRVQTGWRQQASRRQRHLIFPFPRSCGLGWQMRAFAVRASGSCMGGWLSLRRERYAAAGGAVARAAERQALGGVALVADLCRRA